MIQIRTRQSVFYTLCKGTNSMGLNWPTVVPGAYVKRSVHVFAFSFSVQQLDIEEQLKMVHVFWIECIDKNSYPWLFFKFFKVGNWRLSSLPHSSAVSCEKRNQKVFTAILFRFGMFTSSLDDDPGRVACTGSLACTVRRSASLWV